jgi:hypothetical protein
MIFITILISHLTPYFLPEYNIMKDHPEDKLRKCGKMLLPFL